MYWLGVLFIVRLRVFIYEMVCGIPGQKRRLMNTRMIMVLVLVILIREQIIIPMLQAVDEMEQPLNGVEPLRPHVCEGCGEGCTVGGRTKENGKKFSRL